MSKDQVDAMIRDANAACAAHNARVAYIAALRDRTMGPVARFAAMQLARAQGGRHE